MILTLPSTPGKALYFAEIRRIPLDKIAFFAYNISERKDFFPSLNDDE